MAILNVNIRKTKFVSFHGCHQLIQFMYTIDNTPIQKVTTINGLGLLFEILLQLNKAQMSIITGILTGHIRLNYGNRDDPDCGYCGRDMESAKHFLCEFTELSQVRYAVYGQPILTTNKVMSFSIKKIANFVYKSGRFLNICYHHINIDYYYFIYEYT